MKPNNTESSSFLVPRHEIGGQVHPDQWVVNTIL